MKTGDVDGDGDEDVVATSATHLYVFFNDAGVFTNSLRLSLGATINAQSLEVQDMNGDGQAEIMAAVDGSVAFSIDGAAVAALSGPGPHDATTLARTEIMLPNSGGLQTLTALHLDEDGTFDLLLGGIFSTSGGTGDGIVGILGALTPGVNVDLTTAATRPFCVSSDFNGDRVAVARHSSGDALRSRWHPRTSSVACLAFAATRSSRGVVPQGLVNPPTRSVHPLADGSILMAIGAGSFGDILCRLGLDEAGTQHRGRLYPRHEHGCAATRHRAR